MCNKKNEKITIACTVDGVKLGSSSMPASFDSCQMRNGNESHRTDFFFLFSLIFFRVLSRASAIVNHFNEWKVEMKSLSVFPHFALCANSFSTITSHHYNKIFRLRSHSRTFFSFFLLSLALIIRPRCEIFNLPWHVLGLEGSLLLSNRKRKVLCSHQISKFFMSVELKIRD